MQVTVLKIKINCTDPVLIKFVLDNLFRIELSF